MNVEVILGVFENRRNRIKLFLSEKIRLQIVFNLEVNTRVCH